MSICICVCVYILLSSSNALYLYLQIAYILDVARIYLFFLIHISNPCMIKRDFMQNVMDKDN